MESSSVDNAGLDELKRTQALAALRRIATATRPELRQALDDYLAIIDGSRIVDSPGEQEQSVGNPTAPAQVGSD